MKRTALSLGVCLIVLSVIVAQGRQKAPFVGNAFEVLFKIGAKPGTNKIATVAESDTCTVNVLGVSSTVKAHYHKVHEETVTVLRGGGTFNIAGEDHIVKPGDVMHIPRGLAHSFVPNNKDTVVVSIFSPKFDPADRIFID